MRELPIFPNRIFSEGQGVVGIRHWFVSHEESLETCIKIVADSHFPGYTDCLPISIQDGAFWEGVRIHRPEDKPRLYESLGQIPEYGASLIVAQYALHHMTNTWPKQFPKPWHPPRTTLSLRIRAAGQNILMPPFGVPLAQVGDCGAAGATPTGFAYSRTIVNVTEYHITCGRMKLAHINKVLSHTEDGARDWDNFMGMVNRDGFMGAKLGTLLFDNYELDETFASDPDEPYRYTLTAILKQRNIIDANGLPMKDALGNYVGWNHDYFFPDKQKGGWRLMNVIGENGKCEPRYKDRNFANMFGGVGEQATQNGENGDYGCNEMPNLICGPPNGLASCSTPVDSDSEEGTDSVSFSLGLDSLSSGTPPDSASSSSSSSSSLPPCDQ